MRNNLFGSAVAAEALPPALVVVSVVAGSTATVQVYGSDGAEVDCRIVAGLSLSVADVAVVLFLSADPNDGIVVAKL